ncbi:hypothetical protein Daura_03835 [Dactylosporangium aurantiacum]|uniref:NACHT domain-containing protein n=1 Tax=Dactylosporangium aurantiacum TaxID=35754 RepID=A0A9Q9MDS2_9ACTN|nr:hypothetical protein [Dactylosporangium aurantiacum]MDG6100511.1 hypothetical protein [Dactylosporangium aurantiacum]UWZ55388.1 hypothetical protein Daura_03835 [Dactylosporangium aurantiacum]
MSTRVAARGPLGGSENEQGGDFRADYAAHLAAHGLRGLDVEISGDERTRGRPYLIRAEVDEDVDDLEVVFDGGRRVLLQLKKSLDLAISVDKPFRKVIDQWVQQVVSNPDDDTPLVVVAASGSAEIQHLADALDRRRDRHASLPSPSEKKALTKLDTALARLAPAVRDAVLDRASVTVFPWHARHGGLSISVAMLDGNVVAAGQGGMAVGELAKAHRKSASLRSGLDFDQWVDLLAGRFTLLTNGAASAAARKIIEDAAVRRYCERLGNPGSIDLLSVGADLPPIEADIRCWVSAVDGEDKEVELDDFFRRYGRVLMIGAPGSGKSTALRDVAQREAHRGWCLPVLIDLRRLLQPVALGREHLPILELRGNPLDELAAMAVEAAEPEDRPVLTEAIRRSAGQGRLLLCLDSLDETRKHRREVVSWIRRLVSALHVDCDVLLATRSSAHASAAILGWTGARLLGPRWPRAIAEPIIHAVAQRDGRDSVWVGARLRLLDDQLTQTPYLGETPLLVTALALELCASGRSVPTFSKAELMDSVSRRIALDWERRSGRGGISMPDLPDRQIEAALSDALSIVGWECVTSTGSPPESYLLALLSERFHADQGLPLGKARILSESCLDFWDEAGVLVRDDEGGLNARARNVVEASAARHLADAPLAARALLLGQAIADPAMTHVLTMAVALNPEVLTTAVDLLSAEDSIDVLLALADGVQSRQNAPQDAISELIASLSAMAARGDERALEAAEAICGLPASLTARSRIREQVRGLVPPHQLPVWEAMLAHRWDEPDALTLCLDVAMSPPEDDSEPPHITEDGIFDLGGRSAHDGPLEAAMLGAAMRLPSGQPDAAQQIQEVAYKRCDHRIRAQIDGLLAAKGYQLVDRSRETTLDGIEAFIARSRQEKAWLLERLSELGPLRPLKAVERRRLNNVGRVVHGLAYMKLEAGAIGNAIRRYPADLTRMINFVVDCGGLDRSTVASEAIARLQEPEGDVALLCELPRCRLTHWDVIDVPETLMWLGDLLRKGYLLARQSQLALSQVPGEYRPQALNLARTAAENQAVPTRNRFLAAQLACYFNRDAMIDRWRDTADPVLRSSVMSVLREHPERQSILLGGIRDTDNLVRVDAVEALTDADLVHERILEALRYALANESSSTCQYCGLGGQTGEERNCSQCELALPDPQRLIRQKLNAAAKFEV